jgi:CubicO group peptidase (beta-lactamase class C family)
MGLFPEASGSVTMNHSMASMMVYLKAFMIALLVLWAAGCHSNPSSQEGPITPKFVYRDPFNWPISTPAAQRLDTVRVAAGMQEVKRNTFILAFLVVRNDSLILEYYNGYLKENDFEIHSETKSFTSALVGIAIDKGIIHSAQDKILGFFPDLDTIGLDPRKRDWTIEQFLTMRSGLDWDEGADHSSIYTDKVNWLLATLKIPLAYAPGERFIYTTPNANLLSGILTRTSGMSTYDFAEQNLFKLLNIAVRDWLTDPQGIYAGGSGSRFTPRDLARFGQLYLRNGMIDGKQIVSKGWIQQTLIPRNQQPLIWADFTAVNYGYFWWNNYTAQDSVFMAGGFAGQFIFVVPAKNMVIVTIGNDNVTTDQANVNENIVIGIVKQYFL